MGSPISTPHRSTASGWRSGNWRRFSRPIRPDSRNQGRALSAGRTEQTRPAVLARKVLGKFYPPLSRVSVDFSVKMAEASLGTSLKRLGRERLDILFIHEPNVALIEKEEWQRWFDGSGSAAGCAPSASQARLRRSNHFFQTLARWLRSYKRQIASTVARPIVCSTHSDRFRSHTVISQQHAGPARAFEPRQLLVEALRRNRTGTILVSTRRPERLADYSAALVAVNMAGQGE